MMNTESTTHTAPIDGVVVKPLFVLEIERTTGLVCEFAKDLGWRTDWWVMAPTGVPMFKVGGDGDMIGSISQPDMYAIHGIDAAERSRRRRS